MENFQLTTVDTVIMVVYGLVIIGYGLYKARSKNSEEYFLGGRAMIWPVVGISLFAANISSSTLVGLAGDAYSTNTHVYNYEWMAAVILVFFAIFFMPFYLKTGVYTMPEFLERRFDSRSRYYFSFVTIISNIIVDTAAGLYVGLLIFKILFPSLPAYVIIIILAAAAAAYTIPGGLSSVIHTEVIQAILLILGSIVLTFFAFREVGGWGAMVDQLNALGSQNHWGKGGPQDAEEVLSMVRGAEDEFMPWTGLLIGVPILGFYFWITNQFMVQRVLSAKNLDHGRWGALFAGLLKLPVIFIMVLPGVLAILLFRDLDLSFLNYETIKYGEKVLCRDLSNCPNMTYPVLLFKLLPTGLLGLVLAGLLAAMMSSISATFNSASTLITMDFVSKLRPNLNSQQLVAVGQVSTLVLVILAAAWAPQIERFGSLFKYLQLVISFICPPVVGVFILGLFWKRANGTGAFVSLIIGFLIAATFLGFEAGKEALRSEAVEYVRVNVSNDIASPEFGEALGTYVDSNISAMMKGITDIHFLHKAALLMLICVILNVWVSLMTPPPSEDKIADYTWSRRLIREETKELEGLPWYQNYRVLSFLLLIATAIIVGFFW